MPKAVSVDVGVGVDALEGAGYDSEPGSDFIGEHRCFDTWARVCGRDACEALPGCGVRNRFAGV